MVPVAATTLNPKPQELSASIPYMGTLDSLACRGGSKISGLEPVGHCYIVCLCTAGW